LKTDIINDNIIDITNMEKNESVELDGDKLNMINQILPIIKFDHKKYLKIVKSFFNEDNIVSLISICDENNIYCLNNILLFDKNKNNHPFRNYIKDDNIANTSNPIKYNLQ